MQSFLKKVAYHRKSPDYVKKSDLLKIVRSGLIGSGGLGHAEAGHENTGGHTFLCVGRKESIDCGFFFIF